MNKNGKKQQIIYDSYTEKTFNFWQYVSPGRKIFVYLFLCFLLPYNIEMAADEKQACYSEPQLDIKKLSRKRW